MGRWGDRMTLTLRERALPSLIDLLLNRIDELARQVSELDERIDGVFMERAEQEERLRAIEQRLEALESWSAAVDLHVTGW